jgi:putative transcriptional regulator
MPATPTLNNCIRELRARRDGMTQQALAESVGVTRQTIISIESGRYAPSLLLAFKIAEALDAPIEKVFGYR